MRHAILALALLLLAAPAFASYDYRDPLQMANRIDMALAASVASSTQVDITNIPGNTVHITGTETILSFFAANQAGTQRTVIFDGALTLTHNTNAITLPGGVDITTAAGDVAVFVAETSDTGKWRCVSYNKAAVGPAELGALDGVTATATEINTLDGVVATLTYDELNILDGVTASAVELNYLAGVDGANDVSNKAAFIDGAYRIKTVDTVGSGPAVAGLSAVDSHGFVRTAITLDGVSVGLTDVPGSGQWGAHVLYNLPAGNNVILGVTTDVQLTLVGAEWLDTAQGTFAVGTAAITNTDAFAGTEKDISDGSWGPATAQVANLHDGSTATLVVNAAGTTDSVLYLNIIVADNAAHITSTATLTGTVYILWTNFGDF